MDGDDGFGEFPPQFTAATPEITTPQTTNRRDYENLAPSRIRFAEDATSRLSPMRNNQVLVLGGNNSSHHQQRQSASAAAIATSSSSTLSNRIPYSSHKTQTPEQKPSASLDFSMITTPGGKEFARMVDNETTNAGLIVTPSEVNGSTSNTNGRWTSAVGTPFSTLLRGVVSSSQLLNNSSNTVPKTPYTNARESLRHSSHKANLDTSYYIDNNGDENALNDECTALNFARSAPLSGYLRKLGKNIPTFKRRFFVLKPSTHLYYFLSPHDVEPRGCIDLDRFMTSSEDGEGVGYGTGGCEVREIGVLPDGTFRFELLFEEKASEIIEEEDNDNASTDTGSRTTTSSQTSLKQRTNQFQKQSIVLEARSEELGREWMSKLQSERLSTKSAEAEYLATSLEEMKTISQRWETSACEEAMRADGAERQRNTAIAEAKVWEGKFTDLNEALRLLMKNTTKSKKQEEEGGASSSDFMEEAFRGLDLESTNFNDISDAFKNIHNDYNILAKKEEGTNKRVEELERRLQEAEDRASKAESKLATVWEDNRVMQMDLKKTKREKRILVKEVKSMHAAAAAAAAAEENASKQSAQSNCNGSVRQAKQHYDLHSTTSQSERSRGGTSDGASSSIGRIIADQHKQHASSSSSLPKPKRKLNDKEKRLVIELEEHVMSGLRLSEQFLTLNGVDPSEVGDDLDDSVAQASVRQASKCSVERSPERTQHRRHQEHLQEHHPEHRQPSRNLSPPRAPSMNLSPPPTITRMGNETLQKPLGSLMDENEDDESEAVATASSVSKEIDRNSHVDGANMSYTAESTVKGSNLLNDIYQYEEAPSGDNLINQNLNERFIQQITPIDTSKKGEESMAQCRSAKPAIHLKEISADRATPSLDMASSVSESSRSRVMENGNATTKLQCPLRDVGETPLPKPSTSNMGDDGKVYHITFYSSKIGLQFQKVPNESSSKSTGLLTEAMTADHGPNVETNQTAAELRRIASLSRHSHHDTNNNDKLGGSSMECHPVSPEDAVLVCGFVGFDDSTGNCRPRIGARLVAFDGITVEIGPWTFESIRKSIKARGRPLTLSFRNDFLTQKQRVILTKAIDDVNPPPLPLTSHSKHQYVHRENSSTRERLHHPDHYDDHYEDTISTSTTTATSSIYSSRQQHSQQQSKNKYYSSFSEAGSSISSAVAPLVSNLLSNKRSSGGKHQGDFAPDYLRRTSDSLAKMRHHHDFQSGLL